MVVLATVSNREGHCDFGEEALVIRVAPAGADVPPVIVAGVENQSVGAGLDDIRPQAGDPTARVGRGPRYLCVRGRRDVLQPDLEASGRRRRRYLARGW